MEPQTNTRKHDLIGYIIVIIAAAALAGGLTHTIYQQRISDLLDLIEQRDAIINSAIGMQEKFIVQSNELERLKAQCAIEREATHSDQLSQ
ncbi:MAG: hypothetical protein NUV98_02070 [Candidatus Roizmanbacteria bacterium]|nr:hypothetical protein [Candidatus Roizmanbacteria bacterium]